MKLLILTQIVDLNNDLLGFMHGWVEAFSKKCEKVTVVCLKQGDYRLPVNVKVLSLGKETGKSKIKYLVNFYKHIWRERQNYDTVFVHMNKEYAVLGGWYWRLVGKRIALWYVHKQTGFILKLAEKIVDIIFTASTESFRLKSSKIKIVGHGIDLNEFFYKPRTERNENFKIIYVGRISKIKNQKLLIKAVDLLVNGKSINNLRVDFIGSPVYAQDIKYFKELTDLIKARRLEKYFNFTGSLPHKDIAATYRQADLSVNLCPTGGMDKAVLESMAVGLPIIAYNKTFIPLLGRFNNLILEKLDRKGLADKISGVMKLEVKEINSIGQELRNILSQNYSLAGLIDKIVGELSKLYGATE